MATTVDNRRETVSLIGSDKLRELRFTAWMTARSEPFSA